MNIVTTAIVNNEWFLTYDLETKEVITMPTFIDENTSATIGIIDSIKVEVASTEQELLNKIVELNLITKEIFNT